MTLFLFLTYRGGRLDAQVHERLEDGPAVQVLRLARLGHADAAAVVAELAVVRLDGVAWGLRGGWGWGGGGG